MVHAVLGADYNSIRETLEKKMEVYSSSDGSILFVEVKDEKIPVVLIPRLQKTLVKVDPIYKGKSSTAKKAIRMILDILGKEPEWSNL